MTAEPDQAVFILGIEHRSGTNFLADLLALHDDCCRPATIGEDFFLHHAQLLDKYVAKLHGSWHADWRKDASRDEIGAVLGRSLLSLLTSRTDRPAERLITKTPKADQLALFPWLFPDHPLLIIIREGRSLVESAVRSFGWSYPKAIDQWARGAQSILEFDRDHSGGNCRYLVIRYEDLVTDLEPQMRRILRFLRLDAALYDFDAAASLPVRGSSMIKMAGSELHWKPVPKTNNFNPLKRADNWTPAMHRRFYRRAGHLQQLLGYSLEGSEPSGIWGGWVRQSAQSRWQQKISKGRLQPLQPQVVEHAAETADVLPFRRIRRAA